MSNNGALFLLTGRSRGRRKEMPTAGQRRSFFISVFKDIYVAKGAHSDEGVSSIFSSVKCRSTQ